MLRCQISYTQHTPLIHTMQYNDDDDDDDNNNNDVFSAAIE